MAAGPLYEETVTVEAETDQAILVNIDAETFWIPRSLLVEPENEVWHTGDEGNLAIPEWLAEEKGIV